MTKRSLLLLDEKFEIIRGFLYGLRYPSLMISIKKPLPPIEKDAIKKIIEGLSSLIHLNEDETDAIKNILDLFRLYIFKIQALANWAIFEEAMIIEGDDHYALAIPVIHMGHQHQWAAIRSLTQCINNYEGIHDNSESLNELSQIISLMKNIGIQRENVLQFLKTAFKEGIPFTRFGGKVYQYGYGKLSHLQDSSFTEQSSQISATLARDKTLTLKILSEAGIPTPIHANINRPNDAIQFANTFGFPIVIKPGDQDGGIGVTVDINNESEINLALNKAREFSKNIVVENYISGQDYRLVVFRGNLIWAVHRMPAHVKGDGKSSIKEIVATENKKSTRNKQNLAPMKPLDLTEETLNLLAKQGLNPDSILKNNEIAYLKKQGNISSGGTPVSVFDKVHEDNRLLAVRSAEALRLDLAGIDLLMPDITKSWREVGGAICEVNAQPMLGSLTSSHLYGQILNEVIPKKGRPPINLVLNFGSQNNFGEALTESLNKLKIKSCLITKHFINNDGFLIQRDLGKELASIRDRNIDVFTMIVDDEDDIKNGLAFQYINNIVILTDKTTSEDTINKKYIGLLNKILPMCNGYLFTTSQLNKDDASKLPLKENIKIKDQLSEEQCLAYLIENLQAK